MSAVFALKTAIRNALPRAALQAAKQIRYTGSARTCSVCGVSVSRFLPQGYGYPVLEELQVVGGMRKQADECPMCHSADRTRLIDLYTAHHSDLLSAPGRLLHIAPEPGLFEKWSKVATLDYTAADLDQKRYRHIEKFVSMDLQASPLPDCTFDWIVCNHVLEHVPDDRKAMHEIFRMLKPGGTALLQVPIALVREATEEDPALVDEAERIRRFGQRDHIRLYARDYYDRLREAGLEVELWDAFAHDPDRARDLDLNPLEKLTVAHRPRS